MFADLVIEQREVSVLTTYTRTLKKRDDAIPRMMAAIREFGFRVPLLITGDNLVIDGEVRLEAARALGMTTVPVIVADDLTPTQVRTFRLSVNRSATWAEWDQEELKLEFAELRLEDVDLATSGFLDAELDALLQGTVAEHERHPDEAPALPEIVVSCPGDVWLLGLHRVMCGDSTSPDDVDVLMDGESCDMVWTDPPYNVDYKRHHLGKIENDKLSPEAFDALLASIFRSAWGILCDGGVIYVAHPDGFGLVFRQAFKDTGFHLASCLIWRKNEITIGRCDYQWMHEPILYGWKPTAAHRWFGDRRNRTVLEQFTGDAVVQIGTDEWQVSTGDVVLRIRGRDVAVERMDTTILEIPKPPRSDLHPTQKPVALIEKNVANSCPRGGLVVDLCGGSGSTLIACDRLGRRCNLMDKDPRFVDTSVRRWMEHTGRTALHAVTGKPFPMEAAHE